MSHVGSQISGSASQVGSKSQISGRVSKQKPHWTEWKTINQELYIFPKGHPFVTGVKYLYVGPGLSPTQDLECRYMPLAEYERAYIMYKQAKAKANASNSKTEDTASMVSGVSRLSCDSKVSKASKVSSASRLSNNKPLQIQTQGLPPANAVIVQDSESPRSTLSDKSRASSVSRISQKSKAPKAPPRPSHLAAQRIPETIPETSDEPNAEPDSPLTVVSRASHASHVSQASRASRSHVPSIPTKPFRPNSVPIIEELMSPDCTPRVPATHPMHTVQPHQSMQPTQSMQHYRPDTNQGLIPYRPKCDVAPYRPPVSEKGVVQHTTTTKSGTPFQLNLYGKHIEFEHETPEGHKFKIVIDN